MHGNSTAPVKPDADAALIPAGIAKTEAVAPVAIAITAALTAGCSCCWLISQFL
ncbi:MAG: hypothetical protein AB8W37_11675 [Arsenophonus endosymbiont of Dermacentor nuttalli]